MGTSWSSQVDVVEQPIDGSQLEAIAECCEDVGLLDVVEQPFDGSQAIAECCEDEGPLDLGVDASIIASAAGSL